ncbi:MAG: hypothetical protein ACFFCS_13285 [Candidatus Hodarchaeota archaeon]
MSSQTFRVTKLAWISILSLWAVVSILVLIDPSLRTNPIEAPWEFIDIPAIVIFIVTLIIMIILMYALLKRFKKKSTNSIKLLLMAYIAFLVVMAASLIVEIVHFTVLLNDFLNRTIFTFTAVALINWFLFIMEIFDGGLTYPRDSQLQSTSQFKANWVKILLSLALLGLFLVFLTKSVWIKLTTTESILQTIPVLVIGVLDMLSLLVKPVKMLKKVEGENEKLGLRALFLSGIVLLVFFIFYVIHNISGIGLEAEAARATRGVFYYLSMVAIPVFCTLNYVGIIVPARGK